MWISPIFGDGAFLQLHFEVRRRRRRPLQFGLADAGFRTGDHGAISVFTNRSNEVGLRSFLAGIEAPRSARRFATMGSSRALSSAAASLPTTSFRTLLGAKMPAQMSRSYLSPTSLAAGMLGNAGKRSGAETT